MITCPNCKQNQLEGTIFCSECGSQLAALDPMSTQSLRSTGTSEPVGYGQPVSSRPGTSPKLPELALSLHLVDSSQVVYLSGRSEYTLGRVAGSQAALPDVDLSPFDAYGQGVSRIHAAVRVAGARVSIVDLGSSNGTRINGQKLNPQTEYPLNHGDIIALGKLKIQFLYRK